MGIIRDLFQVAKVRIIFMADQNTLLIKLVENIKCWGRDLGFQQIGISRADMQSEQQHLDEWLKKGYQGQMQWMENSRNLRLNPDQLHPGTIRVISARVDYQPPDTTPIKILKSPQKAYISRYALGRDYHKLIRKRLSTLALQIQQWCQDHLPEYPVLQRPFADSAPVLERPFARNAGLGWIGKHTLLLDANAGSWFFLGEIYTNLPLPETTKMIANRCGDCSACLNVCPTDAFPRPYQLDASRCISYLTIEYRGIIPEQFREPMGNRVFGCDDCQLVCPWNKYAKPTCEKDFHPRHKLESSDLLTLFNWDEKTFLEKTAGSPIRRIGYENWQRNLAIGLGNAPSDTEIIRSLEKKQKTATELVVEHINWALQQQKTPDRKRTRKIKNASN